MWHGNSLNDSTSNGNTLTFAGSGSSYGNTGKISPTGAFSFNGSGWATAGDQSSLDIPGGVVSFSCWQNQGSDTSCFSINKCPPSGGNGYEFLVGPGGNVGQLVARTATYNSPTGNALNDGQFHLCHAVISDTVNRFTLYADANSAGTGTSVVIADLSSTAEFQIGARAGSNRFTGPIEEVRVFEGPLNADWILAEYNSQVAPGSFASYAFDAAPSPPATASSQVIICG